jgi:hypothetical protein
MITLPTIIHKNGFTYTQVLREGRKYIYQQTLTEKTSYFEVFIARINREHDFSGIHFEEKELFPGNEDFGKTAWSCRTYMDAKIRFDKLRTGDPESAEADRTGGN